MFYLTTHSTHFISGYMAPCVSTEWTTNSRCSAVPLRLQLLPLRHNVLAHTGKQNKTVNFNKKTNLMRRISACISPFLKFIVSVRFRFKIKARFRVMVTFRARVRFKNRVRVGMQWRGMGRHFSECKLGCILFLWLLYMKVHAYSSGQTMGTIQNNWLIINVARSY